jgi:hypothetical protein
MNHGYTYQSTLAAGQVTPWRVEDIIGGDKRLDFSKPFMPEALAWMDKLTFLSADEKRILNQIRGNTYLSIFELVEEFILPFALDEARPHLLDGDYRLRALLQLASEEAKHIQLFKTFKQEFAQGFGTECAGIGPADEVAKAVLAHQPLAVAITILTIEWMSQRHYLESIKDDQGLDPQFKSLLRNHWVEEAQHAKTDTLVVEWLAEGKTEAQIMEAIEEFLDIGGFLDNGLKQQVELDMDAFMRATGRELTDAEKEEFRRVQHQANRWTYLGSGMTHEKVLGTLESLTPKARQRIESVAPAFC